MPRIEIPIAFKDLFKPSRYKAFHGGRGSAKSHSFAGALVLRGVQRPIRWLCAREIQRSLTVSVKKLIEDKIIKFGLTNEYTSTRDMIQGANGTTFLFAGLRTNPESIKSMEGLDGAWVEEANRCSQQSLTLLIPTVRKPDSEIWFSWNRGKASDPVDRMFLGELPPPPDSIVRQVSWRDNPFFPDVLKKEMEWMRSRDVQKWRHIWEGELERHSQAKVFSNFGMQDLDSTLTSNSIPYLGVDWGFSVDPTVLVECYVIDRTLYFSKEIYKVGCEIDDLPALFAGSNPNWINRFEYPGLQSVRDGYRIVADSARPETISYMRRSGFNIVGSKKGPNSIKDGIEFLKSYDIVVHPRCKAIINEMTNYSYKVDPLTEEVLPVIIDLFNHTIDAARYAIETVRRKNNTGTLLHSAPQILKPSQYW